MDAASTPSRPSWLKRPSAATLELVSIALLFDLKLTLFLPMAGLKADVPEQLWMTVGLSLWLACGLAWVPARYRLGAVSSLSVLLALLLTSNLVYLRYFHDLLSMHIMVHAGQAATVRESVLNLLRLSDLLLWVDLPVLVWLAVRRWRGGSVIVPPGWRLRVWTVALVLGSLACTKSVTDHLSVGGAGMFHNVWSKRFVAEKHGVLFYHLLDAAHFLRDRWGGPAELDQEERRTLRETLAELRGSARPQLPSALPVSDAGTDASAPDSGTPAAALSGDLDAGVPKPASKARPQNVIIVQVEALQAQVIHTRVEEQEVTPNLNRLAASSWYVPHFYHQTAQGRTSDAEYAVLCSALPLSAGAVYFRYPRTRRDCLPSILGRHGYSTIAFHGNEGTFWNRRDAYPGLGIQRFDDESTFRSLGYSGLGVADGPLLMAAEERLAELKRPQLALAVLVTSHHPFDSPPASTQLELGALEGTTFGRYLTAIRYVDEAIGAFIARLKASGRWDESIVVIYGDHDVGSIDDQERMLAHFGVHGDLAEEAFRRQVPLFIHVPGSVPKRFDQAVGQIDLAPTLIDLLGLKGEGRTFLGRSLLREGPRIVAFRDGSATSGEGYYLAPAGTEPGRCWGGDGQPQTEEACSALRERAALIGSLSDALAVHGLGAVEP